MSGPKAEMLSMPVPDVGARGARTRPEELCSPVVDVARKHKAGVAKETSSADEAYAPFSRPAEGRYREGPGRASADVPRAYLSVAAVVAASTPSIAAPGMSSRLPQASSGAA